MDGILSGICSAAAALQMRIGYLWMQSEKPQKLPDTQKYPGGLAVLANIFRKLAEVYKS